MQMKLDLHECSTPPGQSKPTSQDLLALEKLAAQDDFDVIHALRHLCCQWAICRGTARGRAQSRNRSPSPKRPSGWETMINVLQVDDDHTPGTHDDHR